MEFTDVLENVPKDRFKATTNKLLNECFILKKSKDTASDYNFILNYKDFFISMFDVLGYELVIQEDQGVIGLNNPAGTGRIHLKKIESVIILILRLLYIEERKKLSQTSDVIVAVDQLIDKYNMLKIQNSRLDKTTLRNTLGLFRRYHLVQNIDSDMSNPDTRIIIYPSILFAVSNASLEEMYQSAKDKLEKYSKGGDADERSDSADNEETD